MGVRDERIFLWFSPPFILNRPLSPFILNRPPYPFILNSVEG